MSDIYEGRLVADGNGNLLADEGPRAGEPVAYHEGSFVFIPVGEKSHNERHHENFAEMAVTQTSDADWPGYAGSPDDPVEGAEHHFGPLEDDPHYSEGATNEAGQVTNTKLRFHPDSVAAKISGHTAAIAKESE